MVGEQSQSVYFELDLHLNEANRFQSIYEPEADVAIILREVSKAWDRPSSYGPYSAKETNLSLPLTAHICRLQTPYSATGMGLTTQLRQMGVNHLARHEAEEEGNRRTTTQTRR